MFLSGAGTEKADVRVRRQYTRTEHGVLPTEGAVFRVEAKTTSARTYTFRVVDWDDLARSARAAGEEPVFAISFATQHQDYVLIRGDYAKELGFETGLPYEIAKSWTLVAQKLLLGKQRCRIYLRCAAVPVVLVLLPYNTFLAAL